MSPVPVPDPRRDASPREIRALIRLLDDPAEEVQRAVRGRLSELSLRALPHLREAQEHTEEPHRSLLQRVIDDLHIDGIETAWRAVLKEPSPSLERGAFLLALYYFPELDVPHYQALLEDLAHRAFAPVTSVPGAERAFRLCEFVCRELEFTGNQHDYYHPHNSCLNWVLDHRQGIPISLSVVYLLLGQRLGLPVFGVNMPAHFLVKYEDGRSEVFFDLFNGGIPLAKDEAVRVLVEAGLQPQPEYLLAAPVETILFRMTRNLLNAARRSGSGREEADLLRLIELPDEAV